MMSFASPLSCKDPLSPFALLETGPIVIDPVERSPRVIRLLRRPDDRGVGILTITKKLRTDFYVFCEIPCAIGGRGFALHRLGLANLYHVRVGTPRESSCECLGFLSHGRCKHIQGLTALIGHNLL